MMKKSMEVVATDDAFPCSCILRPVCVAAISLAWRRLVKDNIKLSTMIFSTPHTPVRFNILSMGIIN
jgi:hypothetical protein